MFIFQSYISDIVHVDLAVTFKVNLDNGADLKVSSIFNDVAEKVKLSVSISKMMSLCTTLFRGETYHAC